MKKLPLLLPLLLALPFLATFAEEETGQPDPPPELTTPVLLELIKEHIPDSHVAEPRNLEILESFAEAVHDNGDSDIAVTLSRKAFDQAMGLDSIEAAVRNATNTCYYLFDSSRPKEILSYCDSAMKVIGHRLPSADRQLLLRWKTRAAYYLQLADEAIFTQEEVVRLTEELFGEDSEEYCTEKLQYAVALSLRDPIAALRLQEEYIEKLARHTDPTDPAYINELLNLSQSLLEYADYAGAEKYLRKANECLEASDNPEIRNYQYEVHAKLGGIAFFQGDFIKAENEIETATRLFLDTFTTPPPVIHATLLHNHAVFIQTLNPEKSLALELKAAEIRKDTPGEFSKDYISSINNIQQLHFNKNDYDTAYGYARQAVTLTAAVMGKRSQEYVAVAGNLFNIAGYRPDLVKGDTVFSEALGFFIPSYKSNVRNNFQLLSSQERSKYWAKTGETLDNLYWLSDCLDMPQARRAAYDGVLFQKGILLSTDIEFQKLLNQSGDPEVRELVAELTANNSVLRNASDLPMESREETCDSLLAANKKIELELQAHILQYDDFTRTFDISSRDVQRALRPGEAAVEFISVPAPKGEAMMGALVLDSGDRDPAYVRLRHESEMEPEDYLGMLMPHLEGKTNVYFSPTGAMHSLPLESLTLPGDTVMACERWNLYRLSSTRELALDRRKGAGGAAGVFGGMDFDTADTSGTMPEESETMAAYDEDDFYSSRRDRSLADVLNMRSGAAPLPQTRIEAETVAGILERGGYLPAVFTGTHATEDAIKRRSGAGDRLLHIATHGFYYEPGEKAPVDAGGAPLPEEEIVLMRSGLLFAGANKVLKGEDLPEGIDDGILTAAEIARLNFSETDLVALSACETGLGDTAPEGVFGLQRAFKKAGAGALLMSLWEVDDRATMMLMSKFYEEYLAGKTKREALLEAQRHVRDFTEETQRPGRAPAPRRPFAAPDFWSAFILLDALD